MSEWRLREWQLALLVVIMVLGALNSGGGGGVQWSAVAAVSVWGACWTACLHASAVLDQVLTPADVHDLFNLQCDVFGLDGRC